MKRAIEKREISSTDWSGLDQDDWSDNPNMADTELLEEDVDVDVPSTQVFMDIREPISVLR